MPHDEFGLLKNVFGVEEQPQEPAAEPDARTGYLVQAPEEMPIVAVELREKPTEPFRWELVFHVGAIEIVVGSTSSAMQQHVSFDPTIGVQSRQYFLDEVKLDPDAMAELSQAAWEDAMCNCDMIPLPSGMSVTPVPPSAVELIREGVSLYQKYGPGNSDADVPRWAKACQDLLKAHDAKPAETCETQCGLADTVPPAGAWDAVCNDTLCNCDIAPTYILEGGMLVGVILPPGWSFADLRDTPHVECQLSKGPRT